MEQNTPQQNPPENKSSIGSILGTIIILAIIILGALYFWGKRIEESRANSQLNGGQANVVETLPPIEIHVTATSTATTTLSTHKK
jgi:hypothetical protein